MDFCSILHGLQIAEYSECNECIMKEQCCGLFTTSKAFLKPKVTPIGGKYD